MKYALVSLILVFALAGSAPPSSAEDTTHILSEIGYNFFDSTSKQSISRVASLSHTVTGNYSAAGDLTCTIALLAPEGKVIRFTTPPGFTTYSFSVTTLTDDVGEGDGVFGTLTPTFIQPNGDIPTLVADADSAFLGDDPPGYAIGVADNNLVAGQSFTFRGIRLVVEVPAAYDGNFMDEATAQVQCSAFIMGAAADPGVWVEIVDDPVLAAQRVALLSKIKRTQKAFKSAKRKGKNKKAKRLNRKLRKLRQQLAAL